MNFSTWICEGNKGTAFSVDVAHEDNIAMSTGFNLLRQNNKEFGDALYEDQDTFIGLCYEGHTRQYSVFFVVYIEYLGGDEDGERLITYPNCIEELVEGEDYKVLHMERFVCTVYEEKHEDDDNYDDVTEG